jgi:hypothetical protein
MIKIKFENVVLKCYFATITVFQSAEQFYEYRPRIFIYFKMSFNHFKFQMLTKQKRTRKMEDLEDSTFVPKANFRSHIKKIADVTKDLSFLQGEV